MSDSSLVFDILFRDRASAALGKVGKEVDSLGGKLKSSLKSAFSPKALIGAATGGGLAISAFGATSIKAFSEAQAAQSRLTNAFEKFPQLAGANADGLRKINTELQRKTKFDDDATASAQAVLAGFGLTEDQLKTITPLLQDYASRTGKDLPTAAQDLGKAILGQGRALKGIGINFKDTGSAAGNFGQLVDGLRTKVGGFAAKEGTTAAGKMAILKNQFGEMQEKVGQQLLPVLVTLADFVATKLLPGITKLGEFVARNKPLFLALAAGITAALVPAFAAWAAAAIPAAAATIAAAAPVIALGAAVAGVALVVIKNWDTIKGAFVAVFNWIKGNWPLLLAIIAGPFGLAAKFVIDHWNGIVDFVTGLPGRIGKAARGMWDGIKDAFKSAINWIIKGWNNLEFKLPKVDTHIPGVGKIGGWTLGTPDIPLLHSGGMVTSDFPRFGGLASDERLAVLEVGEHVTPRGAGKGLVGELHQHFYGPTDPNRMRVSGTQGLRDAAFLLGA